MLQNSIIIYYYSAKLYHTFALNCGIISVFGLRGSFLLLQLFNMVIIANQPRSSSEQNNNVIVEPLYMDSHCFNDNMHSMVPAEHP